MAKIKKSSAKGSVEGTSKIAQVDSNVISIDEDHYEEIVDYFAYKNSAQLFLNTGKSHAGIVLSRVFGFAKNNLKIFTGEFDSEVTDARSADLINKLGSFIKRGGNLQILFERVPSKNNKLFRFLSEETQVDLRHVTVDFKSKFLNGKDVHFTTGDGRMFRFENDTINYKAVCSFNNASITKKLDSIFDKMFKESNLIKA